MRGGGRIALGTADAAVSLAVYPEAFPVICVVPRRVVGGGQTVVMRRAVTAHLNSAKVKGMLRGQGALVVGDPPPAAPAAVRGPSMLEHAKV